jgi:hypothetical protein
LLAGVGVAVSYSLREKREGEAASRKAGSRITVKVLTGSEAAFAP